MAEKQNEAAEKTLDIVFDGLSERETRHFVDIEIAGTSIKAGTWVRRGTYWMIRITADNLREILRKLED